jgi:hypothetical protein
MKQWLATPGCRLGVAWLAVLILWTVILPSLGRLPRVDAYIQSMQTRGINPSALFYTEHPAGRDWERSLRHKSLRQ